MVPALPDPARKYRPLEPGVPGSNRNMFTKENSKILEESRRKHLTYYKYVACTRISSLCSFSTLARSAIFVSSTRPFCRTPRNCTLCASETTWPGSRGMVKTYVSYHIFSMAQNYQPPIAGWCSPTLAMIRNLWVIGTIMAWAIAIWVGWYHRGQKLRTCRNPAWPVPMMAMGFGLGFQRGKFLGDSLAWDLDEPQNNHRFLWIFMDIYGYLWIFMDVHGCSSHLFQCISMYFIAKMTIPQADMFEQRSDRPSQLADALTRVCLKQTSGFEIETGQVVWGPDHLCFARVKDFMPLRKTLRATSFQFPIAGIP